MRIFPAFPMPCLPFIILSANGSPALPALPAAFPDWLVSALPDVEVRVAIKPAFGATI
jgi:hypothetical protein